jgi:hypothetical protein
LQQFLADLGLAVGDNASSREDLMVEIRVAPVGCEAIAS